MSVRFCFFFVKTTDNEIVTLNLFNLYFSFISKNLIFVSILINPEKKTLKWDPNIIILRGKEMTKIKFIFVKR